MGTNGLMEEVVHSVALPSTKQTAPYSSLVSNRKDGVVVRASTLQSVDWGSIPLLSHTKRLQKMVSTAFLLGMRHIWEVVENKLASLLVVSLVKALNGMSCLYVEDMHPDTTKMATPKQMWTSCPKYSNTIRFLMNGG